MLNGRILLGLIHDPGRSTCSTIFSCFTNHQKLHKLFSPEIKHFWCFDFMFLFLLQICCGIKKEAIMLGYLNLCWTLKKRTNNKKNDVHVLKNTEYYFKNA